MQNGPPRIPSSATDGAESSPGPSPLAHRRERIVRAALGAVVWVGLLAYIPSVWAGWRVGAWWIIAMDTAVYAAILLAYLHPRTTYRVGAGVLLGSAYLLGVVLSLALGPHAAGPLWLCSVPILAAAFFDRRTTLGSLAVTALTVAGVTGAQWLGYLHWERDLVSLQIWVVLGGNLIVISAFLALAVASLIQGLDAAVGEAGRKGAELAAESRRLVEANTRLEEEMARRERAEASLRQSEKFQAIGTLAAGIAHDFNNLLLPILTGAEVLRDEEELREEDRIDLADRILSSAQGGRDLVRRLLAFSRPSSGERSPADAGTAFGEAARLLRATLPGTVELSFEAGEDVGAVLLSPAEIHQIILNLGGNAYRAMPDGGHLRIIVDAVDAAADSADAAARAAAPEVGDLAALLPGDTPPPTEWVRIRVEDTGIGMTEEVLTRATEPFFTTRPDGEGTGIGLATVQAIAATSGGAMRIHSQPGEGTTVSVFLPRLEAEAEGPAASAPLRAEAAPKGNHILVVDDEEAVRGMTIRVLERAGYRTSEAMDGVAALEVLAASDSEMAAVISDLSMPRMNGLKLAKKLREAHPTLPVLLASGLVDDDLRSRARKAGADLVLSKPFSVKELLGALSEVLGGGVVDETGPREGRKS